MFVGATVLLWNVPLTVQLLVCIEAWCTGSLVGPRVYDRSSLFRLNAWYWCNSDALAALWSTMVQTAEEPFVFQNVGFSFQVNLDEQMWMEFTFCILLLVPSH